MDPYYVDMDDQDFEIKRLEAWSRVASWLEDLEEGVFKNEDVTGTKGFSTGDVLKKDPSHQPENSTSLTLADMECNLLSIAVSLRNDVSLGGFRILEDERALSERMYEVNDWLQRHSDQDKAIDSDLETERLATPTPGGVLVDYPETLPALLPLRARTDSASGSEHPFGEHDAGTQPLDTSNAAIEHFLQQAKLYLNASDFATISSYATGEAPTDLARQYPTSQAACLQFCNQARDLETTSRAASWGSHGTSRSIDGNRSFRFHNWQPQTSGWKRESGDFRERGRAQVGSKEKNFRSKRKIVSIGQQGNYQVLDRPDPKTSPTVPSPTIASNTNTGLPPPQAFAPLLQSKQEGLDSEVSNLNSPSVHLATDSGYGSFQPTSIQPKSIDTDLDSCIQESGEVALNDSFTVYSAEASVETSMKDSLIEEFVNSLYHDLGGRNLDEKSLHMLCENFQDSIANFALRLGQEQSSSEAKNAMVFIYKYRSLLKKTFELLASVQDEDQAVIAESVPQNMPLEELMQMWDERRDTSISRPLSPEAFENESEGEDFELDTKIQDDIEFAFSKYQETVLGSFSYQWLLTSFRNTLRLSSSGCSAFATIQSYILSSISRPRVISSRAYVPRVEATIYANWPLRRFLDGQGKRDGSFSEIGSILSFTGSVVDAQAMTCGAYVQQIWPTSGMSIVRLFETALSATGREQTATCRRPDGTRLSATLRDEICTVQVEGTRDVVAEVALQLAWLSSTLRASSCFDGVTVCTPRVKVVDEEDYIRVITSLQDPTVSDIPQDVRSSGVYHRFEASAKSGTETFYFNVYHESGPDTTQFHDFNQNGACWRPMLGNPVLVAGFPILRKPQPWLGMEMPLNVMAELIGTNVINEFADDLYLKGFSAMLVPSLCLQKVIVWHLHCDQSGKHISYTDYKAKVAHLDFSDIENARHIVVWCTQVTNLTGKVRSEGSMGASGADRARSGCILDDYCLQFGKTITQEPSFTLLDHHKSLHIASGTYFNKLRYLSQRFTLLWDVGDNRGWLTSCLKAFLDLARSSLQPYGDPLYSQLQACLEQLNDVANEVLGYDKFRDLVQAQPSCNERTKTVEFAHPEKDEAVVAAAQKIFSSCTDQLYDAFDKLITIQEKIEHDDLRKGRRSLRVLEGWDYIDLTNSFGTKRPRLVALPTIAFTWARWIRSFDTMVLFGRGFGELLVSEHKSKTFNSSLAPSTQCIPGQCCDRPAIGTYCVSVTLQDLDIIVKQSRSRDLLANSDMVFTRCEALHLESRDKHYLSMDFVQTLWPREHGGLLQWVQERKADTALPQTNSIYENTKKWLAVNPCGAITFGHNRSTKWYINEKGQPVSGTIPDPASEIDDGFDDSGVGSSLSNTHTLGAETDPSLQRSISKSNMSTSEAQFYHNTYGNSAVSGGQAIFGNVYNITNTVAAMTTTKTDISGCQAFGRDDLLASSLAPTFDGLVPPSPLLYPPSPSPPSSRARSRSCEDDTVAVAASTSEGHTNQSGLADAQPSQTRQEKRKQSSDGDEQPSTVKRRGRLRISDLVNLS